MYEGQGVRMRQQCVRVNGMEGSCLLEAPHMCCCAPCSLPGTVPLFKNTLTPIQPPFCTVIRRAVPLGLRFDSIPHIMSDKPR